MRPERKFVLRDAARDVMVDAALLREALDAVDAAERRLAATKDVATDIVCERGEELRTLEAAVEVARKALQDITEADCCGCSVYGRIAKVALSKLPPPKETP